MYMWVVYLLQNNCTNELYFGITKNLRARIAQHNRGGHKYTTRQNSRWILIYAEAYRKKSDADNRELRLKDHDRAKQELLKRVDESLKI